MKVIRPFLFAALFYSCNGATQPKEEVKAIDENLLIKNKTTLSNTYTKSGLLDISYKTDSMFFKGKFATAFNFIIKRNYDSKNNLVSEKTFDDPQTNELSEEKIFSYDVKNNLISEIEKLDGNIRSIIKKYYNEHNQETKRIEIQNNNPEIYFKNQSNPLYDTLIIVNSYDPQGNLIKQTTSSSSNAIGNTIFTIYSNGQKTFAYELDENSDTTTKFEYKKAGGLVEETVTFKSEPNSYLITWYEGNKKIKSIFYDGKKIIETFKYDEKGNEVENISYQ